MALYDIKGVKEIAGGVYQEVLLQNEFIKLDQTTSQTITGQPIQASLTASQLVATDASKKFQSLNIATYPSLTELSYIKGLTSAVQTQLNGKQATLTNPVTGTGTANEISYWTGAGTQGTLPIATYPSLTELAYVKGVTSNIQTQLNNKASASHTHGEPGISYVEFNLQTGTSYTLVPSDVGKIVRMNNTSPITVNIDIFANQAIPSGSVISIEQTGAGIVTVVPLNGFTINTSFRKTWGQNTVIQLYIISTNVGNIIGGV